MVRRVRISVVTPKTEEQQKGKARVRINRKNASNNSLKPKTRIVVEEGFNEVLTANDKAVQITYTR
ncbi:hypothetical protein CD30_16455 [Ureibacillus massiliensis 4400831 = CIP 108448 = CCUG 49529]|uniref:Uncharacterized protein n=1 Tax=Ureibacillus massiliensis 4400831 = CIP 108448 = CCUG 49529 TaxID=1211035 RepID=A0A0A3J1D7_9BACL|nr:hypothetical protein [Ureibacillus massiliensis]KGR89545.1 hypothetical protein CD30_16455 [Ureibacillus massiliensis 4400831 = CIP 108448 = CCUG 49529]